MEVRKEERKERKLKKEFFFFFNKAPFPEQVEIELLN